MRAAIFDMDGTMVDSNSMWVNLSHDFLLNEGIAPDAELLETMASLTLEEGAAWLRENRGLRASPAEIVGGWLDMAQDAYANRLELKPGVDDFLTKLREAGFRLAVATGNVSRLCLPVLERTEILHHFDTICTSEDVLRGKEHPDIYLVTAQRLGVQPERCVVYEDILAGLRSARAAGMSPWAVLDPQTKGDWEIIKAEADGYLYDFTEAPIP